MADFPQMKTLLHEIRLMEECDILKVGRVTAGVLFGG